MRRDARFIDGARGKLLVVEYLPEASHDRNHAVILIPPFAEEMNRSRRMMALAAERLADLGYRVAIVDLYGTGDSEGDFADARWAIWRADLAIVEECCRAQGAVRLSLLALRTGALLALDCEQAAGGGRERVVLWQPCPDGNLFLRQFLRIRLAAGMASSEPDRETMNDLIERLAHGQAVEVAGYELSAELAMTLKSVSLEPLATTATPPVDWLDIVPVGANGPSEAGTRVAAKWRSLGVDVRMHVVPGEPFWNLQETTVVPALLDATTAIFAGSS